MGVVSIDGHGSRDASTNSSPANEFRDTLQVVAHGLDTVRVGWRDPAAVEVLSSYPGKAEGDRTGGKVLTQQQPRRGVTIIVYRKHGLVAIEGRAASFLGLDDRLTPISDLPAVDVAARRLFDSEFGVTLRGECEIRRVDYATDARFASAHAGAMFLEAARGLGRNLSHDNGRHAETVTLQVRRGQRLNFYDGGALRGTNRPGELIRVEFQDRTRRTIEQATPAGPELYVAAIDKLLGAAPTVVVASHNQAQALIDEWVNEGRISAAKARTACRHLVEVEQHPVRQRRWDMRKRLQGLGLILRASIGEPVEIGTTLRAFAGPWRMASQAELLTVPAATAPKTLEAASRQRRAAHSPVVQAKVAPDPLAIESAPRTARRATEPVLLPTARHTGAPNSLEASVERPSARTSRQAWPIDGADLYRFRHMLRYEAPELLDLDDTALIGALEYADNHRGLRPRFPVAASVLMRSATVLR